jgi:serine/threonine protein phosphatase PrpC
MLDYSLYTNPGGRENNEDYVAFARHGEEYCFVLCDGLGGHDRGEVAAKLVADSVTALFEAEGDSMGFLDRAFNKAQSDLLARQDAEGLKNAMKTTAVVLTCTPELVKWAHIGDSRLYRFFDSGTKYERTRDHSLVQRMADTGEIRESEIRQHPDRNKIFRVMGAEWGKRSYDKSPVLELEDPQSFLLATDGFWEYVYEEEMMVHLRETQDAEGWLEKMTELVKKRADMSRTDNFSAIAVRIGALDADQR